MRGLLPRRFSFLNITVWTLAHHAPSGLLRQMAIGATVGEAGGSNGVERALPCDRRIHAAQPMHEALDGQLFAALESAAFEHHTAIPRAHPSQKAMDTLAAPLLRLPSA